MEGLLLLEWMTDRRTIGPAADGAGPSVTRGIWDPLAHRKVLQTISWNLTDG